MNDKFEHGATDDNALLERVAQIQAHRACCGAEHDPSVGKLHGCCVVCGVPWPCSYAGTPPDVRTDATTMTAIAKQKKAEESR